MTDKEKLQSMLPYSNDSFESIVEQFLRLHMSEFTPSRLRNLMKTVEVFIDTKIHCYEIAVNIAHEKAHYLKSYLEGKLWKSEKSARANVDAQITNAKSIIHSCQMAAGKRMESEDTE